MAMEHNFRSAFNGFNREDVVRYIEYLNTKHVTDLNQLKAENQTLTEELKQFQTQPVTEDLSEELAQQKEQYSVLEQQCASLQVQVEQLTAQLAERQAKNLAAEELEAYRRAERAERSAKDRAEKLYQQATGTLADATAQVDEAAGQFRVIAEGIQEQMRQLQLAIEGSKNTLLNAAAAMYTIRPEDTEA